MGTPAESTARLQGSPLNQISGSYHPRCAGITILFTCHSSSIANAADSHAGCFQSEESGSPSSQDEEVVRGESRVSTPVARRAEPVDRSHQPPVLRFCVTASHGCKSELLWTKLYAAISYNNFHHWGTWSSLSITLIERSFELEQAQDSLLLMLSLRMMHM